MSSGDGLMAGVKLSNRTARGPACSGRGDVVHLCLCQRGKLLAWELMRLNFDPLATRGTCCFVASRITLVIFF